MTASIAVPRAPQKTRVALWDNARFVLIALVVIGHVISTVRTDTALGFGLYAYIYLFHMPAMIMLSGLFSRAETSPKAVRSTVQLLLTWLVWEALWAVIRFFAEGKLPGSGFLINPAWTLWFLVSLVTMRILLPYLARMRHPLLVSIVLALAGGLSPVIGTEFSAARTLVFLPFFVAGWLIRDRGWLDGAWFTRPSRRFRAAAWGVLVAIALAFAAAPRLQEVWRIDRWLTWRDDYFRVFERAPIGDWHPESWGAVAAGGIAVSAVLLGLAALMTFAVLVVVPRGRGAATVWGSRTLYVYLLHGPIVYFLRSSGTIEVISDWGPLGLPTLIILGLVITVILSTAPVARVFRPIIEPRTDWLFTRD
ncbi:MAG: acyltransferase family protein [Leucobacter sp.]